MSEVVASLLAAGMGSRLGEITSDVPKPLLVVDGRPIIEHDLLALRAAGVRRAVVNTHHLAEVVRGTIGDGSQLGMEVSYTHEEELLGTAGALLPQSEVLGNRFIVVYADNLFRGDIAALLALHEQRRPLATIGLLWREDVRASGEVFTDPSGRVERVAEKQDLPAARAGWVNAGLVVAERALLDWIPTDRPADLVADVLAVALAEGQDVVAAPFEGTVTWVDTPADYEAATSDRAGGSSRP